MASLDAESGVMDVSDAYKLYITLSIFTALTAITTSLRLGTRLRFLGGWLVDDWFMVLAAAVNVVASGFDYTAISYGFGRHEQFLSQNELMNAKKYAQLAVLMAWIAVWATKVSVCFFLLRLVSGNHSKFVSFLWMLTAFTTITTLVTAIMWGVQARPLAALWDPGMDGYVEGPRPWIISADVLYACSAITSFSYALCPFYFLWEVQINSSKKLAIWGLMGLGLFVGICAILVIALNNEFLKTDVTWSTVPIYICSIVERNLGVIVANLAPLRPLFARWLGVGSSVYTESTKASYHSHASKASQKEPTAESQPIRLSSSGDKLPTKLELCDASGRAASNMNEAESGVVEP